MKLYKLKPLHGYCALGVCWFITIAGEPAVPYKAVVIVPVADAIAHPLSAFGTHDINLQYASIPFSPQRPSSSCCRTHQLKKNEQVTILTVLPDEVECKTEAFYYECASGKQKSTFWVLKKNVVPLETLTAKHVHIPPGIDKSINPKLYNKNVLTLSAPWLDAFTQEFYSVGTRFSRCAEQDTATHYAVYMCAPELKEKVVWVPKNNARHSYPNHHEKALPVFMQLLREWACMPKPNSMSSKIRIKARMQQASAAKNDATPTKVSIIVKKRNKEIIPYVYGGCSFRGRIPARGFYVATGMQCGKKSQFWQRHGTFKAPLDGFDCSNMILCAAQIAGMPYYYKNTYALLRRLKDLKKDEPLEEGDLVWYKGHVLVISDLKKNLLIEASGYEAGNGKIQEISVDRVFEGIANFEELLKAFHEVKTVRRLTGKGRRMPGLLKVKILKLRSIWQ